MEGGDSEACSTGCCVMVSTIILPDSGARSTDCCAMVSTSRSPDSGAVSTGCCAMGSTTRPPDSGAVSTGCCTMGSTTKRSYSQAPNRIINLNKLQSTVDQFLGPCPTCKGILKLEEKHTVSFATTLEIVCKICIDNQKKEKQKVRNLKRIISNMKKANMESITQQRATKKKMYYLNGQLKKKEMLHSERMVLPTYNKKFSKRSRIRNAGRQGSLESEINLRAMMSAYYTGTGGFDIGNVTAFLGIPGGKSWERTYHRHSPSMTKLIMKVAEDAMLGALDDEIEATIREKLDGQMNGE